MLFILAQEAVTASPTTLIGIVGAILVACISAVTVWFRWQTKHIDDLIQSNNDNVKATCASNEKIHQMHREDRKQDMDRVIGEIKELKESHVSICKAE